MKRLGLTLMVLCMGTLYGCATGNGNRNQILGDSETGLAIQQVEIYPQMGPIRARLIDNSYDYTAFSPDGKLITASSLWDSTTGRELKRRFNRIICWSPDMKRYLVGAGTVQVRDWETDSVIFRFQNILVKDRNSKTQNITFSPDGGQIAAITSDQKNIKVWDTLNGQEMFTITTDPESSIIDFSYGSDGKTILFRDSKTVKIFDIVNNQQIRSFSVVAQNIRYSSIINMDT